MAQQYYFDTLPIRDQLKHLESLTSYLTRLAEINGINSMTGLAAIYSLESAPHGNVLRYLNDYPLPSYGDLELVTGYPESKLLQATFHHLIKKFGRSSENSLPFGFLSKSIGSSLRYCSACLDDSPYYILPWRFLELQGCYKHACKFFDKCPHCGGKIPFLALPLKIGICPACRGDLRLCRPEALTTEESREAFIISQEIEFLVSPQNWEDTYVTITKNIGKEYALLRHTKGYSVTEIRNFMGVKGTTSKKIAAIDFGRVKGATFQDYVIYAKYLNVSLQEIFGLILTRTEGDACFEKIRREFLPTEEYILEKTLLIVDRLKLNGEQLTRQAVREELRISETSLRKYPRVKDFLDQHAGVFHYQQKKHVQSRKNEVFDKAMKAIACLSDLGKPITYNSVGEFMGVPASNLKANPQVVSLIKEHGNFHDFQKKQHLRREEELLSQVQGVVLQMRNRGQAITRSAVAREVGMHLAALQWYGQIKDFLDREVDVTTNVKKQVVQARERENEVLIQVENAVQQLEEKGQKISRRTISDFIGVGIYTLIRFPRVRLFLEEKVNFYQQIYMQAKEDELLEKLKEAVEILYATRQKVTQRTLARAVSVSRVTFKQYPRVVRFLEENTKIQVQIHENNMMIKVKEAIRVLEENNCKITHSTICKQLDVPTTNLNFYPSVIVFVQNMVKEKQKQYKEKQLSLEEELLMQSVLGAIRQLQSQGLTISYTAIAKMLHTDPRKLKKFPKIKLILDEVCSSQAKDENKNF